MQLPDTCLALSLLQLRQAGGGDDQLAQGDAAVVGGDVALQHGDEPLVARLHVQAEDDLADEEQHYLELNAELSREWPVITEKKDGPPDAAEWENKPDKLKLLER